MLHALRSWLKNAPRHPFKLARYVTGPSRARTHVAGQPVILVVYDDQHMAAGLSELLQLEDYQTRVARDGVQGLEICQNERVDLALVNNTMPRMGGMEMIALLREDRATAHILAILMTAYNRREIERQAYQCGADDILIKPIDPEELLALVQVQLRRGRRARRRG